MATLPESLVPRKTNERLWLPLHSDKRKDGSINSQGRGAGGASVGGPQGSISIGAHNVGGPDGGGVQNR